jgi:hypothetical protein
VKQGETLALIAQNLYGRVQYERILVAANGLETTNGAAIVAGMRLEIPAVSHYRVKHGDSYASIAAELLGAKERAIALAEANDSKPWLAPDEGAEIVVPYNLRVVASGTETTSGLAYKYLADRKHAWMLEQYNIREGKPIERGETLLIPLVDLPLTEAGKQEAKQAETLRRSQGAEQGRAVQRAVDAELPALGLDVKSGRYVDAVARAMHFLARGELSKAQVAKIHRQLLEAFTALGAKGRARESCRSWLENDPSAVLDPVLLSPKILELCPERPKPAVEKPKAPDVE